MGDTGSYACGVQIRPHSEARETEAGITEEGCVQKKHTALVSVVSITYAITNETTIKEIGRVQRPALTVDNQNTYYTKLT